MRKNIIALVLTFVLTFLIIFCYIILFQSQPKNVKDMVETPKIESSDIKVQSQLKERIHENINRVDIEWLSQRKRLDEKLFFHQGVVKEVDLSMPSVELDELIQVNEAQSYGYGDGKLYFVGSISIPELRQKDVPLYYLSLTYYSIGNSVSLTPFYVVNNKIYYLPHPSSLVQYEWYGKDDELYVLSQLYKNQYQLVHLHLTDYTNWVPAFSFDLDGELYVLNSGFTTGDCWEQFTTGTYFVDEFIDDQCYLKETYQKRDAFTIETLFTKYPYEIKLQEGWSERRYIFEDPTMHVSKGDCHITCTPYKSERVIIGVDRVIYSYDKVSEIE